MNARSHWGIADVPGLVAEIDRDLKERQASYPALIEKGRLKPEEADYLLSLLADIRRDLDAAFGPPPWIPPSPAYGWSVKVRWMRAELERREATYPDKVDKGRLTQADADRRILAMRGLVHLYWRQLFAWTPPAGAAADYLAELERRKGVGTAELYDSPGARELRQLVRDHMVTVSNQDEEQGRLVA